ncbi:hypothetical protein KP509_25G067300 [Ceratopteris richardii]|nr:hypothetical protein KP509_25G067300 [Ceratopteris richardii]
MVDYNNFRNLHHEAPERQTSDQKSKLLGLDHSSSFSKESSQMTCSDQCDAPSHASGHLTGASSRLTGCKLSASMEEFEAQVSANDHSTLLQEALKGEVRLELVTYELLVKAIHLKGPLNWAQEKLLTDVRLQLGITSAEQAIVLKKYMPSSDGRG